MTTTNSHIHQSRYKVTLPDGGRADIRTNDGAEAFFQDIDFSRQYITNTLQDALTIIREKPELDPDDKQSLMQAYTLMHQLALNTSKPVFKEAMLESNIRTWFDLAIDEIRKLSTKQSWILTGILNEFEEAVLHPCVTFFLHPAPVAIAFETDFLSVFADFIRARKGSGGGLPSPYICTYIGSIMFYACSMAIEHFDICWEPETVFKRLEACGILEQFLRCVTIPQFPESDTLMCRILDQLAHCSDFLWLKFRVGTPCGDTLRAIVAGKDGSKTERKCVMKRLRGLVNEVENMQPPRPVIKLQCEHCGKSGTSKEFKQSLLCCSRCKQTQYCSKECQRADWKKHKKSCVPPNTKQAQIPPPNLDVGLNNFVLRNGSDIAMKIIETCENTGLTMDDMMIEVNFMPNPDGIIPAMQTPADFQVAPLQDYIDGKEELGWLSEIKDPEKAEADRAEAIVRLKGMQAQMTKNKAKKCMFLVSYNGLGCVEVPTKDQSFLGHMIRALFQHFTTKHRQAILDKLAEACSKHGVVAKDLVMELDFVENKKGVVPAMQTPPIFNIIPAKRYLNKSRPKEKDWFFNHQHPEILPAMKKGALQVVKDTPRGDGDLVCLLHFYGGLADRMFSQSNAIAKST